MFNLAELWGLRPNGSKLLGHTLGADCHLAAQPAMIITDVLDRRWQLKRWGSSKR